jgi:hypothetical protein
VYVFQPRGHPPTCNLPGSKANILINDSGHACLADFSLLTIVPDQSTVIFSCVGGGTIPWMSPELLDPESFGLKEIRLTKESDCYALGMVIYEVLSGLTPFAPSVSLAVVCKVLGGTRPERPHGEGGKLFTDTVWRVLERCWESQPRDRTSAKTVLLDLGENPPLVEPSCDVGGDVGAGGGGQLGAAGSGSCAFSPLHPVLIFNPPCAIIGPPIAHDETEPPDPPFMHPPSVPSPDYATMSLFHFEPQIRVTRPHPTASLRTTQDSNGLPVQPRAYPLNTVSSTSISSHRPESNYPRGIVDPPTIHSENGRLIPSHGYSTDVTNPVISRGLAPLRGSSPEETWVGRLARNARRMFEAISRTLCGL